MAAGTIIDPETFTQARRLYETTDVRVADIATLLGMEKRTFYNWRKKWGWIGRMERTTRPRDFVPVVAASDAQATGPAWEPDTVTPSERLDTVTRIRAAIELELSGVERSLGGTGGVTRRGDPEKSARTLASLVRTLNELTRLEAQGAGEPPTEPDDIDIDAFRRELARRLDALCDSGAGE